MSSFVSVAYSKPVLADSAALKQLERPMQLASALALEFKRRVQQRGETATPAKPYATYSTSVQPITSRSGATYSARRVDKGDGKQSKRGYSVTGEYAARLGLSKGNWTSSAEFHAAAGIRHGTYSATGGMWQGLQVRTLGKTAVIMEFAGSSLGSSSGRSLKTKAAKNEAGDTIFVVAKDKSGRIIIGKDGHPVMRKIKRVVAAQQDGRRVLLRNKKARLVRNWEKAGRVFSHHGVCLVQPTDREVLDIADALADQTRVTLVRCFGGESYTGAQTGSGELYTALQRAFGV